MAGRTSEGPGAFRIAPGEIEINAGAATRRAVIVNTADRPVQVGSHFHLAEANAGLQLDRAALWGYRLDIPAGTALRFEPGVSREVVAIPFGGARRIRGLQRAGSPLKRSTELDAEA